MSNFFTKSHRPKTAHLAVGGFLLLFLLAVVLLWFNTVNSNQAIGATAAQVRFSGEYRIGDGPWQEIAEGTHISSTKGDVTLRGNFHLFSPGGEYIGLCSAGVPLAFYTNHVNLSIRESGGDPYTFDLENPLFGASACGAGWTARAAPTAQQAPSN